MAVLSATVEADGWTLAVTGTWPASAWSDFVMDKDGARRVQLLVSGPGFDRVSGTAVAAVRTRETLCHRVRPAPFGDWRTVPGGPIGQPQPSGAFTPWPGSGPTNRPLSEVLNGDGTRTVRLMIHKPVGPGETVVVRFLAGWRGGEPAQELPALNLSEVPIALPSARWITVPYEAVRGSPATPATAVPVDLLAAHILPEGMSAVAGVRVCATDGVEKRFSWLSVGTSGRYGDSVRCWTGMADLSGLSAGLVAIHWSVFPWTGVARHSSGGDPAALDASALHPGPAAGSAGMGAKAETPLMVAFDPVGARYGYWTQASYAPAPSTYFAHVCVAVDPVNGSTTAPADRTAAEAMCGFGATPEAARAAALAATRAANSSVALTVVRRLARSIPAANGAPSIANAGDGVVLFFVDGVHVAGTASIPTGQATGETWPVLEGNGRGVCTVRAALSGTNRLQYGGWAHLRGLRIESGPTVLSVTRAWFHDCEIVDQEGQSPSTVYNSGAPPPGDVKLFHTSCRHDMASFSFEHASNACGIWRSVQFRRQLAAPAIVGCAKFINGSTGTPLGTYNLATGSPSACFEDAFYWYNDCRGVIGASSATAFSFPSYTGADGRMKLVRHSVVNNIFERSGGVDAPFWKVGENNAVPVDGIALVIEGNTAVGDRANHLYNDPAMGSAQDTFEKFNSYSQVRVANNYVCRWAGKHDAFYDSGTAAQREAAGLGPDDGLSNIGRRTRHIQGWQSVFGHLNEGNAEANRVPWGAAGSGSGFEDHGIGAALAPFGFSDSLLNTGWPMFADDRSALGSGLGFGDYRPLPGSPLLGRARTAQIDADARGALRAPGAWSIGAIEGEAVAVPVGLSPASCGHAHEASAATLSAWDVPVAIGPETAVHAVTGEAVVSGTGMPPVPASSRTLRVGRDDRVVRPGGD